MNLYNLHGESKLISLSAAITEAVGGSSGGVTAKPSVNSAKIASYSAPKANLGTNTHTSRKVSTAAKNATITTENRTPQIRI